MDILPRSLIPTVKDLLVFSLFAITSSNGFAIGQRVVATKILKTAICPPGYVGLVRNPANCHTFFSCNEIGYAEEMTCALGNNGYLCFSEEMQACDHCGNVPICQATSTTMATSTTSNVGLKPVCPSETEMNLPKFIGYPDQCDKFYYCRKDGSNGGDGQCAEGLWFDFNKQMCIAPWTNSCVFLNKSR